MSVHPDEFVLRKLQEFLQTALIQTDWCPKLAQLLAIFLNYGATPEQLRISPAAAAGVRTLHLVACDVKTKSQQQRPTLTHQYSAVNAVYVWQTIGEIVRYRFQQLSTDDVVQLIVTCAVTSLDSRLVQCPVMNDLQVCMSVLVNAIVQQDFDDAVRCICRCLATVTKHHHNKVHLVRIFP